ncbi:hypothetical protein WME75_13930 [Sorangium sp. So ce1014]|uniref:hypothetical protein n=1 Tax=Sorangium sp. So ce1014 TaxID=3133326 RepID=UPI003F646459
MHSFFSATCVAALCSVVVVACGGEADPGSDQEPEAPAVDLSRDFIPGDPNFVRDPALDVSNVSARGGQRSHNAGKNCLRCHQEKGPGLGRFVLAGTLFHPDGSPLPNATLRLYATAETMEGAPPVLSDEVATLEVDGYGNFFTTEPLPGWPEAPLYPRFFGPEGEELLAPDGRPAQMGGGVTTGGCNYCHGEALRIRAVEPM